MSAPNVNQRSRTGSQPRYQQLATQGEINGYSQTYPQNQTPYYAQKSLSSTPYIQLNYDNALPAPFIAELPAPLPPAPPTTTPEQQLRDDELLAHKFQQMEVEEVRRRSSSGVSQQQRPVSYAHPSGQQQPPLLPQRSAQSLRPPSNSVSSNTSQWEPGSFGALTRVQSPSSFPDVVEGPRTMSPYTAPRSGSHLESSSSDNLPIPVLLDMQPAPDDFPIPVLLDRQTIKSPQLPQKPLKPASLSACLEEHRQIPIPSTWKLSSILATFYAHPGRKTVPGSDWLSQQESFAWRTIRPSEQSYNPDPPSYTFAFAHKGGSYRDPRFSWTMTCPGPDAKKNAKSKPPKWTYELRLDLRTAVRKKEVLGHESELAVLTTYVHASNYDSLRFVGPDGRAYMWVSSGTVSSLNGARFDMVRHALFAAVGQNPDPLYGEIVADHTFWDGYIQENDVHKGVKCDGCQAKPINGLRWICKVCHHHDVCEACHQRIINGEFGSDMQQKCDLSLVCLPDEALYIRSSQVDPALVIASLQVLKDWEKHALRAEKQRSPRLFAEGEEAARKCDLGLMSYWRVSDWDKKNDEHDRVGTMVKAKKMVEESGDGPSVLGDFVGSSVMLAGYGTSGTTHRGGESSVGNTTG